MNIYPIKNEQDYKKALSEVETLMMAKKDTPEGDRLDVLVTLIESYENKHYALDAPDPIDAIKFIMDQRGLTIQDLVPMIGQTNRVYEVLNRTRPLSLNMIKRLHKDLGIPAESLLSA